MVITKLVASIRINRKGSQVNQQSSTGGDNPVVKLLKSLLKEFKGMNQIMSKSEKLSRSGLGGKAFGTGVIGKTASTVGVIGGLLGGVAAGATGSAPQAGVSGSGFAYEEIYKDGERNYLLINNKTGELVETLDEQQAKQRGIVDANGELLKRYTRWTSIFDEMTAGMERWKGAVVINADSAEQMNALSEEQKRLMQQLNNAYRSAIGNVGTSSSSNRAAVEGFFADQGISRAAESVSDYEAAYIVSQAKSESSSSSGQSSAFNY